MSETKLPKFKSDEEVEVERTKWKNVILYVQLNKGSYNKQEV